MPRDLRIATSAGAAGGVLGERGLSPSRCGVRAFAAAVSTFAANRAFDAGANPATLDG